MKNVLQKLVIIQRKLKMYKIVWINTDVEPVIGFRTNSKENAQKLVDAWSMNFSSSLEVVQA